LETVLLMTTASIRQPPPPLMQAALVNTEQAPPCRQPLPLRLQSTKIAAEHYCLQQPADNSAMPLSQPPGRHLRSMLWSSDPGAAAPRLPLQTSSIAIPEIKLLPPSHLRTSHSLKVMSSGLPTLEALPS
jgi:hypothetical protein